MHIPRKGFLVFSGLSKQCDYRNCNGAYYELVFWKNHNLSCGGCNLVDNFGLKWANYQTKVDNNSHIYNTSKHATIAYSWMLKDFVQELFNLHLQGEHFHL